MLQILDTGIASAEHNMHADEKLLNDLGADPILHLYQWEPMAATYGYFIRPSEHLHLEIAAQKGLSLARRPTGGGLVFHIWDLAFSFLMPSSHPLYSQNTLENYRFVNTVVLKTTAQYFGLQPSMTPEDAALFSEGCQNFCMARPTRYDVVHNGLKIAGAAQRRRRQGYLHQGTISLALPDFDLLHKIVKPHVVEAMRAHTFAPVERAQLALVRQELQVLLAENFRLSLT